LLRTTPFLLVAACGSGNPPAPAIVVPSQTAPPPAVTTAPPPQPPRSDLPAPIPAPSELACAFPSKKWMGQPEVLALKAGGRPFANFFNADDVNVELPVGASTMGATVEVHSKGVTLRGIVEGSKLALHAATAFVADDFVVPRPTKDLDWVEARSPGRITVGVPLPHAIVASSPRVERACADITIDQVEFEPIKAIGTPQGAGVELKLKKIPLYATAGGRKVAELDPGKDDNRVCDLLATQGNQKRIAWYHEKLVVFGWVAATDVAPTTKISDGGSGFGYGTGRGNLTKPIRIAACPGEIPLMGEAEGERRLVGKIGPSVPIHVFPLRDTVHPVLLMSAGIRSEQDANLLVRASDIDSCPDAKK
jgi:hypothetical protein